MDSVIFISKDCPQSPILNVILVKVKVKLLSPVRLFATPWPADFQAPLSMGFSRQDYWSGLPFPSPGDLPDSGIEPGSPALQVDALPSKPQGKPKCYFKCRLFPLVCCCDCLRPHELQQHQAYLSITISQSLLKFMSIESVMPSNHLILCCCVIANSDIIFSE